MNDRTRTRWYRFSTFLIGLGIALAILVAIRYAHIKSQQWLAVQERRIPSSRLLDVPLNVPTATSTTRPTAIPTATPTPHPSATPSLPPPLPIRLIIPKIKVNTAIIEVGWKTITRQGRAESEWTIPGYVVGHHKLSACPGEGSNIVLTGHNNTLGEVFKRLPELVAGDEIFLYTPENEFVYVVEEIRKVRAVGATAKEQAEMARLIGPTAGETLTLVSCWPYVTFTHRIFIIAKPKQ